MKILLATFEKEVENKNEMAKLNSKIKKQIGFMTKMHLDRANDTDL